MTKEETIVFLESIKRGLYQTGKDYPYRDVLIPKMKEAVCKAIKELKADPCDDCVSRKELIDKLEIVDKRYGSDFYWEVRKIVDSLPPVTPAQKTGKWIKACTTEKYISLKDKITVSTYMCSECSRMINNIGVGPFASRIEGYPYCHCGAKMIGVEK